MMTSHRRQYDVISTSCACWEDAKQPVFYVLHLGVSLLVSQYYFTKATGFSTKCSGAHLTQLRKGTSTIRIETNTPREELLTYHKKPG